MRSETAGARGHYRGAGGVSLTTRLTLGVSTIFLVGAAVIGYAALIYGRQAAAEAYDRLLSGAALQIGEALVVEPGGSVVVDIPVAAFALLAQAPRDRVFHRVIGPDGRTLTGYDDLEFPSAAGARVPGTAFFDGVRGGTSVRTLVATRTLVERDATGPVTIVLAQTTEARERLAREITQRALGMLALAGILTLASAIAAIRLSLGPLRAIEGELQRRDPRDLSPLALAAPREVATLVGAIDNFMDRLASRVAVTERMVADAAHQLRTPITAIRAQAEVAGDHPDVAVKTTALGRIHERSLGLSRLVDQLLTQARMINRGETVPFAMLDLTGIAEQARRDASMDASDDLPGRTVALVGADQPVAVLGDRVMLVEAARNLVSNAFAYGAMPVEIRVEIRDDARAGPSRQVAALIVADRGAGIPQAEWNRIGQRFLHDRAGGGAGLGLAIVADIAAAHGGRLVPARTASTFELALELPLATAGSEVRR